MISLMAVSELNPDQPRPLVPLSLPVSHASIDARQLTTHHSGTYAIVSTLLPLGSFSREILATVCALPFLAVRGFRLEGPYAAFGPGRQSATPSLWRSS